jgi:hypothetical protein
MQDTAVAGAAALRHADAVPAGEQLVGMIALQQLALLAGSGHKAGNILQAQFEAQAVAGLRGGEGQVVADGVEGERDARLAIHHQLEPAFLFRPMPLRRIEGPTGQALRRDMVEMAARPEGARREVGERLHEQFPLSGAQCEAELLDRSRGTRDVEQEAAGLRGDAAIGEVTAAQETADRMRAAVRQAEGDRGARRRALRPGDPAADQQEAGAQFDHLDPAAMAGSAGRIGGTDRSLGGAHRRTS